MGRHPLFLIPNYTTVLMVLQARLSGRQVLATTAIPITGIIPILIVLIIIPTPITFVDTVTIISMV